MINQYAPWIENNETEAQYYRKRYLEERELVKALSDCLKAIATLAATYKHDD